MYLSLAYFRELVTAGGEGEYTQPTKHVGYNNESTGNKY